MGTGTTQNSSRSCSGFFFKHQRWIAADRMYAGIHASDLHSALKANFVPANPPFNMSDSGGKNLRQDVRSKFRMPPVNNTNHARIQHFIHHLSPVGVAGFVMVNSSISTQPRTKARFARQSLKHSTNQLSYGKKSCSIQP